MVNNPHASAGDVRHTGLILKSGRSPGRGHGHPLQYSCLENSMDRGAFRVTVRGVAKSDMTEAQAGAKINVCSSQTSVLGL